MAFIFTYYHHTFKRWSKNNLISIWNTPFLKTLKLNGKVTQGAKNLIFIFLKVQFTKLKMDQLGLLFGIQMNISYINL